MQELEIGPLHSTIPVSPELALINTSMQERSGLFHYVNKTTGIYLMVYNQAHQPSIHSREERINRA
jgi:hypothetical protein